MQHTLSTLYTVLVGFAASIIVGFPLAIAITSSPLVANAVYPLLVLTQSMPKVAIAPLLVMVLGANEMPRIMVTLLVAFFPLVISIAAGLLAAPTELVELGRALKMTGWRSCSASACPRDPFRVQRPEDGDHFRGHRRGGGRVRRG